MIEFDKLWDHQKRAVALAMQQRDFALFHDMGAGKTGTMINILRRRYGEAGRLRRTLIVSPLITLDNWKKEFGQFSKVDPRHILILKGAGRKRAKDFMKFVSDPVTERLVFNRVVIMNYESVQMKELYDAIKAWNPEIIVFDEAHRLRNHQSKRARACANLADIAKHRYLLTGSPILNSAMDVFFQYRCLDLGDTFGQNFYAFRNRYFEDRNSGWASKPGYFPDFEARPEAFADLHARMYKDGRGLARAHRVMKKDCLDLPPLVKTKIEVELSPDQRKMYKEMSDEFLTFVEREKQTGTPLAVVAQLAITKALRLQQIVTGFCKAEDGVEYEIAGGNPRLEALEELLEDLAPNGKVIVWACFKQNYQQIARVCDKLKLPYRMIHGEIRNADKQIAMEEFRKDESIKVMIANQGAAGIGVNLVEAPYSVFFSRNFSLEQDTQAEARNYRGGSEMHTSVTRYDIVARNSIDELIADALAGKQKIADTILDWKI